MEEAATRGMPVKDHVPLGIGLDLAIISGQSGIEHLTGYLDPDKAELSILATSLDEYALRTAEAGIWNTPTLMVWQRRDMSDKERGYWESHPDNHHLSFVQHAFQRMAIKALDEGVWQISPWELVWSRSDSRLICSRTTGLNL